MQKSDTSNNRGKWNHLKIIRKYLNNTSIKRDQRPTESSHTGHFIHTTSRNDVKVQNVYQVCHRHEIQETAKLYAPETWIVSVTQKVSKTLVSPPAVSTPAPKQGKRFISRDVFEVQPNNTLTQSCIFLTVGNLKALMYSAPT